MSLAALQADFMAHVLDEDHALPSGWTDRHAAGLDIYRNNYRTSLVEALRSTFERTAKYVGEDAFRQAAAHHLITNPPNSWTLDRVGDGFPDTARELFTGDPEVAELAWLEAAMHEAFVAADTVPLDAQGFAAATSGFAEDDWVALALRLTPGLTLHPVAHDIPALWQAVGAHEVAEPPRLDSPGHLLVWREGLKSVFRLTDETEGLALSAMIGGADYGEMCVMLVDRIGEEAAVAQAGALLGRWLHDGLITGVSQPSATE